MKEGRNTVKAILEVVRFGVEDVVTTSTSNPQVTCGTDGGGVCPGDD